METGEIQRQREDVAADFARRYGVVVVLKGHGTVVADGEESWINRTGNPGMATGGMGDVLTGLIAGLLCQRLTPVQAARLAVFAHGLAGDVAVTRTGELALAPEDLLEKLPGVLLALEKRSREVGDGWLNAEEVAREVAP
jgi:NAD(P)H-hydrate epimerase